MEKMKKYAGSALIAAAVLTALIFIYYNQETNASSAEKSSPQTSQKSERRVSVVVLPAQSRHFENRLVVQGNLEAKKTALVPARVPGTIEEIYVDEGDRVIAGKTKLFQIDSLKLSKAVEVRRKDLEVAKCGLREKIAGYEQVKADLSKDKKDFNRYKLLYKKNTVSADAFETKQSDYAKTVAKRKHALALVDLAREQERQARVSLEIAQKDLRDSLVYAPINGVVSKRFQEPGEMGGAGQPVVRIEDTSLVEASALLPAQYYPRIQANETLMKIRVYGLDMGVCPLTYKSPTIDASLRTFEVKCLLDNKDGRAAPGAMADLEISLEERQGLGVPEEAVLMRGGKQIVFIAEKDAARMIEVVTGLETDGWVEVKSKDLTAGMPVVTMGQTLIEEGSLLKVSRGDG